jgi:hypothetical protein
MVSTRPVIPSLCGLPSHTANGAIFAGDPTSKPFSSLSSRTFAHVGIEPLCHPGQRGVRDGVDPDTEARELISDDDRERRDTGLRRTIVGLADVAEQAGG